MIAPSEWILSSTWYFFGWSCNKPTQSIDLSVLKAHWLICVGQYHRLNDLLTNLLNASNEQKLPTANASGRLPNRLILRMFKKTLRRCNLLQAGQRIIGRQQYKDIFSECAVYQQITAFVAKKIQDIGLTLGRLFAYWGLMFWLTINKN